MTPLESLTSGIITPKNFIPGSNLIVFPPFSLQTLLDLRASPNYKDAKGMTPLYLSVLHNISPDITEVLLKDQAEMNTTDDQGWREIHQVS